MTIPDEPLGYDVTTNTTLVPLEWAQYTNALCACIKELQKENDKLRCQLPEAAEKQS